MPGGGGISIIPLRRERTGAAAGRTPDGPLAYRPAVYAGTCPARTGQHVPTEGQCRDLMTLLTEDPLAPCAFAVGQLIMRMEFKKRAAGMTGPAFDPEVMQNGTCPVAGRMSGVA